MPVSPHRATHPRRLRLQFSLTSLFVLTTLSALATWYWYQRPFAVEHKDSVTGPDWFTVPVAAGPWVFREVEYVRRVWGGKTIRHGLWRVYDNHDNLFVAGNYQNGRQEGEFIAYDATGAKRRLVTYVRGDKHGPSRHWNAKCELIIEEFYDRDLRHGRFDARHADATPAIVGEFDHGIPSGKWSWFPAAISPTGSKPGGTIVGQWLDGIPDGRWKWDDADGQEYLSADFRGGKIIDSNAGNLSPRMLESLIRAAGERPQLLLHTFAPLSFDFNDELLKNAMRQIQKAANVPLRLDFQRLYVASISPDTPMTYQIQDAPLLIGLDNMLRTNGMACDFRFGMLCIGPADSIDAWNDATGVTRLVPPSDSHLDYVWNRTTSVDFVEMPLRDVAEYLGEVHQLRFDLSRLSPTLFGNITAALDVRVTLELRGISFQDCLATLLEQVQCKASLKGETIIIEPQ